MAGRVEPPPRGLTLVLGGARSGKSTFAEALAEAGGGKRLYVATARVLDSEMAERVRSHRERRGEGWETIEAPGLDSSTISAAGHDVILIDCLTLWLADRLEASEDEEILDMAEDLARVCASSPSSVIAVSNEVGGGIVPDNKLARRFRDLAGLVNQTFAREAARVYTVTAGIPVRIK